MQTTGDPIGRRVELIFTSDRYTNLKPGDRGTITLIDDMGTTFVDWDNGSKLGLLARYDGWKYVDKED